MLPPFWTSHRLTILVALLLSAPPRPGNPAFAGDEDRAVILAAIEKAGGKANYSWIDGGFDIYFAGSGLQDDGLKLLKDVAFVRYLDLTGTQVTDAGLAQLQGRKKLYSLKLGPLITDAGLAHVKTMPDLGGLGLQETRVTDAGLVQLEGKKKLASLGLGPLITDAGLRHVREIPDLRGLGLNETHVTDAGLVQLKGMKLEGLGLGPPITDAGLAHLEAIPNLRSLNLAGTRVSDAGIEHLKRLPHLRSLNLAGTRVSDAGIEHLKRLPHLTYLDLRDTQMTIAGLATLREALLRTEIRGKDEVPFFPAGVIYEDDKERDIQRAEELVLHLRVMGEPPLWKPVMDPHAPDVFRLIWLPSFDPPVAVRVVKTGGSVMLYAEILKGRPTIRLGEIGMKKQAKLNAADWAQLQVHLERAQFWKMPTHPPKPEPGDGVAVDGDELICEGVAGSKYHIVNRANVDDPNYNKLCWYVLSLSGLDVEKTWKEYHGDEMPKDADN